MKTSLSSTASLRICGILAIFLFPACHADRITQANNESDFERVVAMGFRADMIEDKGSYFLVEKDIIIEKSQLRTAEVEPQLGKQPQKPTYQWTVNNLVGYGFTEWVGLDLTGLASTPDWATAMRDAMNQWNAIVGTRLRFREVSGNYTGRVAVTTYYDASQQGQFTAAVATFPTVYVSGSGYRPGNSIQVNLGFYAPLTPSQKLFIAAHEIGHTVAFRHSNWQNNPCVPGSEGSGSVGANLVPGTTETDAQSVMNGCTAGHDWNGFSFYDRVASRQRYTGWGPKDVIGTVEGGYPKISWSAALDAQEYRVYYWVPHCEWSPDDGQFICSSYDQYFVGTTTNTFFVDNTRPTSGTQPCTNLYVGEVPYYAVSAVFPNTGQTMAAEEYFVRHPCFY